MPVLCNLPALKAPLVNMVDDALRREEEGVADPRHQRRLPLEVLERRRLELAARLEGEELARRPVAQQVHLGEVAAPEDAERLPCKVPTAPAR